MSSDITLKANQSQILSALSVPFALLKAAIQILRTPRLLILSLIPVTAGFVASVVVFVLTWRERYSLVGIDNSAANTFLWALASLAGGLFGLVCSALGGFLFANIAGALSLESTSRIALQGMGVTCDASPFKLQVVLRSIVEALLLVVFLTILALVALSVSAIPFLSIFPIIIGAFAMGINLLDVPLAVIGMNLRSRLKFCRQNWLVTASLGACFSFILFIPFLGVLLIPLGVVAASRVIAKFEKATSANNYPTPNS